MMKFIQYQFKSLHQRIDDVLLNVKQEQIEWQPPGLVNPIGAILLHMLNAEDFHIQTILQSQARLWESEHWGARIGLAMPPGQGRFWDEARKNRLDLSSLLAYQASARVATKAYLDQLTPEKLTERITIYGGEMPASEILTGLVIHLAGHAGEIAALLGVQGIQGLPF